MKSEIYDDGKWTESAPVIGSPHKITKDSGVVVTISDYQQTKGRTETAWQDGELKKYDSKLQPDRPNAAAILTYRQALRDYILHVDFPNGTRPTL